MNTIIDTNNNKISTIKILDSDIKYVMYLVRKSFDSRKNDCTNLGAIKDIQFAERYNLPQDFINEMKNDL